MMGIFLFALAVSRLLIQRGLAGGARGRHVAVLLDGAAGASQQVGVTTAFGLAQKRAAAMIRELPRGAVVTVLRLGDGAETVAEKEADLHTAAARVEALRPGPGASPITDGLEPVREAVADAAATSALARTDSGATRKAVL